MGRIKVIVKRPLNHYLIIGIYILAPIGNVLLIRIMGNVPFQNIFRNFFNGFGLFAGLWLITAPLIGIGFYFVNRITWYAFIGHSVLIIADYIYKWASRPVYYLKTINGTYNTLMFLGNLTLIIIVGYVIQKNFRAPYFQALQRSWRESVRIPIHHMIRVNNRVMEVNDLSTGGCFILKSGDPLSINKLHEISFNSDKLDIKCRGQIMRQTDAGYGVMFKDLGKYQKRDIHHFLRKRFSLRYKVQIDGEWQVNGHVQPVQILDFSKTGCFAASEVKSLAVHSKGKMILSTGSHSFTIPGEISWVNQQGEHKKPEGFGCSFRHMNNKLLKTVINEFGSAMMTR